MNIIRLPTIRWTLRVFLALGWYFLTNYMTAWRCLLLCAVCCSWVPSRVSKFFSIRRFKYLASWLIFRSIRLNQTIPAIIICHHTLNFPPLEELPSFSENYRASIDTTISYVTQNSVDSPVTACLISCSLNTQKVTLRTTPLQSLADINCSLKKCNDIYHFVTLPQHQAS